MFFARTISHTIIEKSKGFPVVALIGPRQVGKTLTLKKLDPKRKFVTLDNPNDLILATDDPEEFILKYSPPVTIDEIQYAPVLLKYIKMKVDELDQDGLYYLSGSQQFHLMKNMSETLAGRVAIFNLLGLSQKERLNTPNTRSFIPTASYLKAKHSPGINTETIYQNIWQGSFPRLISKNINWESFYTGYINTYVSRDVSKLTNISDSITFFKFLQILASRTGQLLNYASIASDLKISEPTVKSWLSILVISNIVYLLQPYFKNLTSRMIKLPKVYFLDTGLCSFLNNLKSPQILRDSQLKGHLFETYVVSEIIKSYWHNGNRESIYFYRDKDKVEIDLIIEENGLLHPVEIKAKSNPTISDANCFKKIADNPLGSGAIISTATTHRSLGDNITSIPVSYI